MKLRRQAKLFGELPRLFDGGLRKIDPADPRSHAGKRKAVLPKMTLQMQGIQSIDISQQCKVDFRKAVLPLQESIHAVKIGGQMILQPAVPGFQVAVNGLQSGRSYRG